jgi:hypothetical protein
MKRIIPGLKNSQKIRVILNNTGFYTTVAGADQLVFETQRIAVMQALRTMVSDGITGYGGTTKVYDSRMEWERISFQVDLM